MRSICIKIYNKWYLNNEILSWQHKLDLYKSMKLYIYSTFSKYLYAHYVFTWLSFKIKHFIYIYGDIVGYLELWFNYVSSWRFGGYVEGLI